MRIELQIEQLVLDGFAGADRAAVGSAVVSELTRLLAARGVPAGLRTGAAIRRLDGTDAGLAAGAGDQAVGSAVARALYRGLGR